MQKRINELLNSRYMPQVETAEKMYLKIQEINEIVRRGSYSPSNFNDIAEREAKGRREHSHLHLDVWRVGTQ